MMLTRDAREMARRTFRTTQLNEKIAAARGVPDQITPYYDTKPLQPALEQ